MSYSQDNAEMLALRALQWLATTDDLLSVFMGSSGLDEGSLKQGASDPGLLASVLDFLMMDDAWVIRFCDDNGLAYEEPAKARMALPGGEQVHWT